MSSYLIHLKDNLFVCDFQHKPLIGQIAFTEKGVNHATNFSNDMGKFWLKEVKASFPAAKLLPRKKALLKFNTSAL